MSGRRHPERHPPWPDWRFFVVSAGGFRLGCQCSNDLSEVISSGQLDVTLDVTLPGRRNNSRGPETSAGPLGEVPARLRATSRVTLGTAQDGSLPTLSVADTGIHPPWSTARRSARAMNWVTLKPRAFAAVRTSSRSPRSSQKVTRMFRSSHSSRSTTGRLGLLRLEGPRACSVTTDPPHLTHWVLPGIRPRQLHDHHPSAIAHGVLHTVCGHTSTLRGTGEVATSIAVDGTAPGDDERLREGDVPGLRVTSGTPTGAEEDSSG
jgi:hypothetical protein